MENQDEAGMMTCLSERTHYLDVFFFKGSDVVNHQMHHYQEKEAAQMYQRGINKYKGQTERILICLRDNEHQLLKSELLNYK
jgi:hypothetical protein